MSSPHASCQTDSWNVTSSTLFCGWILIINKMVRKNGTISCVVKTAQVGCCFYETCQCASLLYIISFMCLSRTEVIVCFMKSCNSIGNSSGGSLQTAKRKLGDRTKKSKKRADCWFKLNLHYLPSRHSRMSTLNSHITQEPGLFSNKDLWHWKRLKPNLSSQQQKARSVVLKITGSHSLLRQEAGGWFVQPLQVMSCDTLTVIDNCLGD